MTPPRITQADYEEAYRRAHLERSLVAWAMVAAARGWIARRVRAVRAPSRRPRGGMRAMPAPC